MKKQLAILMLSMLTILVLSGFNGQSTEERQAQENLPQAQGRTWQALDKARIFYDEGKQRFKTSFSAELKALEGHTVTFSGFMLPLEPTEKFRHFLLSKRTPTCAFCMPGGPSEIVDVWLVKPVAWEEGLVKVTGTFELINQGEMGLFFRLKKARLQ